MNKFFLNLILGGALSTGAVWAADIEIGGKLLLTRGISTVDGASGSGIVPWAVIGGNETERGMGGTAHFTQVELTDYALTAVGASVGIRDRVEISFTRQEFDTQDAGAQLGIGEGFTFAQDIYGAKLRVMGDAVYDQDRLMPQIAVGALYKQAEHSDLLSALGAESSSGTEYYVSATKLFLEQSVLVTGTLRYTEANQNGLLGFGGTEDAAIYPEASAAVLLSRRLAVGAEYRAKPDALDFAKEDDWFDAYAAFAISPNFTLTAAYADLGSIATFDDQRGVYLSLQAGF